MVSETDREIKLPEEQMALLNDALNSGAVLAAVISQFWADLSDELPDAIKEQVLLMFASETLKGISSGQTAI